MGEVQLLRLVDDAVGASARVRNAFNAATRIHDPLILGATRGGIARARAIAVASDDAVRAERLLAGVATQEPALAPLLDALRSARVLQEARRPGNIAVGMVHAGLQRELHAADAWRHVRGMDREARIAALERFRAGTADQLGESDWKTLAGIIGDDADGTLTAGLPRTMSHGLSIRDLALNVANKGGAHGNLESRFFIGHQYWDAWKASEIPVDARRARIDELLSGTPQARTSDEWRELNALLNAGGHDVVEHPWFGHLRPEFATRHAMLGGYDVLEKFRPGIDTASAKQLDAARRQLLAPGEIDDLARSIVQDDHLERVGIVGAEASAVRLRHMQPLYPQQARAWLTDVGAALRAAEVDGPAASLRESALGLVEKNLARVNGDRWWRWRDGYQTYPDHAELGRIRSTWQLIEQLAAPPASTRAAAHDAGSGLLRW